MTEGQSNELVGACCHLLSVSPEAAQSIIDDLYEDAEIAHFHLATLLNLLKSVDKSLLGDWKEVGAQPAELAF